MKTGMLYILVCCLFLVGCNGKSNKENHADVTDTVFDAISPVDNETDSLTKLEGENLWKEANRYKASITDTTFLRTRGIMSYAARSRNWPTMIWCSIPLYNVECQRKLQYIWQRMAIIGCSFVFYIIILFIYLLSKTSFPIFYTLLLQDN